ncbi:class I SAM-dependent methyltransferase [Actinomadura parmotrematis]|uniref:Methyltransferase domain-containing protein n=1 Tax=Actinomadura parmotrematis TaxID=2864039 RepID=A0ABS7FZ75_9ACTN|nr:methyltransferase domain-containing protein [Actinomadura parmotrematis]MBW8485747.1 methyltransferase domain-containing protein [Actinomadura parmotrematis]
MPQPATTTEQPGRGAVAPHLQRLLDFAEPARGDVCLDVARGHGPMPAALAPRVRHVSAVDAVPPAPVRRARERSRTVEFGTGPVRIAGDGDLAARRVPAARPQPRPERADPEGVTVRAEATRLPYRDGAFSLVTARFSLYTLGEPRRVVRELLRVCGPGGRLVVADLVRPNLAGPGRERLERLRDPDHRGTPSLAALTDLITGAGATVRRMDVFTVERPIEPWLAGAHSARAAERIRDELMDEIDGGPATGARPRLIGGELWFTQSWAHVAAEPVQPVQPA